MNEIPVATQSEETLIGCLLVDPSLLPEIVNIVSAADFYNQQLSMVFSRILDFSERKLEINPITIVEAFRGLPTSINSTYLVNLSRGVPINSSTIRQCAKTIKDKARKRKLQKTLNQIQQEIDNSDFQQVITNLDTELEAQRAESSEKGFESFELVGGDVLQYLEALKDGKTPAISTGFES